MFTCFIIGANMRWSLKRTSASVCSWMVWRWSTIFWSDHMIFKQTYFRIFIFCSLIDFGTWTKIKYRLTKSLFESQTQKSRKKNDEICSRYCSFYEGGCPFTKRWIIFGLKFFSACNVVNAWTINVLQKR